MYEELLEIKLNLQFRRENIIIFHSEFEPVRIPFSTIFLQRLAFLLEDLSAFLLFPLLSSKFNNFANIVVKFHKEREKLSGNDSLSESGQKQILDFTEQVIIFLKECEDFIEGLLNGLKKKIIKDQDYKEEVLLFFESDARNSFELGVVDNVVSKLNQVQELIPKIRKKAEKYELLELLDRIAAILISIRYAISENLSPLIGTLLLSLQLQVARPDMPEGGITFSESEEEFLDAIPSSRSQKIKLFSKVASQFKNFQSTKKKLSTVIISEKKKVVKLLKREQSELTASRVKFYKKHKEFNQKDIETVEIDSRPSELSEQLTLFKKGEIETRRVLNDTPEIKHINQYVSQLKTHKREVVDLMKKFLNKTTFIKINTQKDPKTRLTVLKQLTKTHKLRKRIIQLEKERVGYDNSIAEQKQRIQNIIKSRESRVADTIKQLEADIADLAKKKEK